jgi:hypothetical protein
MNLLRREKLLPACKSILIIGILATFNFLYAFADYSQDEPPIRQWDTAAFYIGEAAFFALIFLVIGMMDEQYFFHKAWQLLSYFFSIRLLFEIYAVVFGADINAKFICASLFYVTLGCIIYLAIFVDKKKPDNKPKLP